MNQLQTNVNDIKSVAKILKKELAAMSFELSHSSALNLASKSLGFKNYQTYKGLLDNNLEEKKSIGSRPFSEVKKEVEKKKLEKYPRIYDNFIKLGHIQEYSIYIKLEDEFNYFLLFEIKNSYTGRVFFSPKYNSFSLFVYPNIQSPINDYVYNLDSLNGKENRLEYFGIIKHLNNKSWITRELLNDLMDLMEKIIGDRKILTDISDKYSNEELEQLYKDRKNI